MALYQHNKDGVRFNIEFDSGAFLVTNREPSTTDDQIIAALDENENEIIEAMQQGPAKTLIGNMLQTQRLASGGDADLENFLLLILPALNNQQAGISPLKNRVNEISSKAFVGIIKQHQADLKAQAATAAATQKRSNEADLADHQQGPADRPAQTSTQPPTSAPETPRSPERIKPDARQQFDAARNPGGADGRSRAQIMPERLAIIPEAEGGELGFDTNLKAVEETLKAFGYPLDKADGRQNASTNAAIRKYAQDRGIENIEQMQLSEFLGRIRQDYRTNVLNVQRDAILAREKAEKLKGRENTELPEVREKAHAETGIQNARIERRDSGQPKAGAVTSATGTEGVVKIGEDVVAKTGGDTPEKPRAEMTPYENFQALSAEVDGGAPFDYDPNAPSLVESFNDLAKGIMFWKKDDKPAMEKEREPAPVADRSTWAPGHGPGGQN